MLTLGIDLASQPAFTAMCEIEWTSCSAHVRRLKMNCDDDELDQAIQRAGAVGIDAPFGWPTAFVDAVAKWTSRTWNKPLRDRLRFRATDFATRKITGRWPLSVSSDLIALPAMRAMALLERHDIADRSGGRFFEVYPAGSMNIWGITVSGYKGKSREARDRRTTLVKALKTRMPWLDGAEGCHEDDNMLDALVASITTWQAAEGATIPPDPEKKEQATREGWIHLPCGIPRFPVP
ncbi:DUF429 domain-containing protein [Haloferula rosea]|uniref:DUF429 domain-containing protein n=1 Tax=Haloferula rosea TaxID=490093 RepID=A0A934RBN0_9BACT|nr:DUF429 domain-containing protein [Haloferula rosea]MBK1825495.1 DUF429 domain-containing protein [Haloferula rosea]